MYRFLCLVVLMGLFSCENGGDESVSDDFNRGEMLVNWADNIIIPAYANYQNELKTLKESVSTFTNSPNEENLASLKKQWQNAYLAWQWVAMFEIGKAETLSLQSYTNMFPTNPTEIELSISTGEYNLELPSRRDQQGFPALDYLINGLGSTNADIVAKYSDANAGAGYLKYLTDVVDRLNLLTEEVVNDWNNGYRVTFVENDGSSATGAVNKVANDYIYYFERHLRASKIGIPAGVFSGTPDAQAVEAYYDATFSKALFDEALKASQAFFMGQHFGNEVTGESFSSYLTYLNYIKQGEDLVALITDQFKAIETVSTNLSTNLSEQIVQNNDLMLNTYDELQKNVINFKVDMLQAMNIKVDYVDADGD